MPHRGENKRNSTLRCTKTGGIQPKLNVACFVQSCLTDADFVIFSNYCLIGTRQSSGVFYGCRAVLTPDRENKRQNGRRFKECGEPAFCLNTQDKHGVYLCACDSCEHALPVKQAADFNKDKSENESEIPLGCGRIRKLTPRECWRLQGFSDEMFDKAAAVNSDAQLYKQAGNGVTIPVVYAVGKRIVEIQNELNSEVKI